MNLKSAGVRIIISEPRELAGKNIFGRVESYRNEVLMVSISTPLKIKDKEGTLLQIRPQNEGESLKPLAQSSAVFIRGRLVKDEKEIQGTEFVGTIVVD